MNSRQLPTKAQELLLEKAQSTKSIKAQETKLTEDMQIELMELIARFSTYYEINTHFMEKHKITISAGLIYQYKRTAKWIPVIKKLREKYVSGIDEVAGMHKRVRLERADDIYNKAIKEGKLRIALAANKDQREEVFEKQAGGNVSYTLNQFNQFVNMTDEELEEKRRELLSKIKTVEALPNGSK